MMQLTCGYILLKGLRFHAFHGVLPQEREVGNDYVVNVRIGYPLATASESDDVNYTLHYGEAYDMIRDEMMSPSALLEHVAERIARALFTRWTKIQSLDLELTKVNPPIGAYCEGASVEMHWDSLPEGSL